MKFTQRCQKIIALNIAILLAFDTLCIGQPAVSLNLPGQEIGVELTRPEIPPEMGVIEEIYHSPSSTGMVFYIQDAHGHYQAQKKTREIIEYLRKNYEVNLLFLEGGEEKLLPQQFRFFKEQQLNLDAADILMRHGEFSGAEMALLAAADGKPDALKGYGIENPDLYSRDLKLFRYLIRRHKAAEKFIQESGKDLQILEGRLLHKALRDFVREWRIYEEREDKQFLRYLRVLSREAKSHLALDLNSPAAQAEYPALTRLQAIERAEKSLDLQLAKKEKEEFLAFCQDKIPQELLEELKRFSDGGESKRAYPRFLFEELYEQLLQKDISLPRYPAFYQQLLIRILRPEIDSQQLAAEIEKLNEALLRVLAVSREEKALIAVFQKFYLFKKAAALELTRDEYKKIAAAPFDFSPAALQSELMQLMKKVKVKPAGRIKPQAISALDRQLNKIMEFYEVAELRENAFMETVAGKMKAEQAERAVLVTGGFHNEGMKEAMKKRGLSYAVIRPAIQGDEKSREIYLKAMLGDVKINSAENPRSDSGTVANVLQLMTAEQQRGFMEEAAWDSRLENLAAALALALAGREEDTDLWVNDFSPDEEFAGHLRQAGRILPIRLGAVVPDQAAALGANQVSQWTHQLKMLTGQRYKGNDEIGRYEFETGLYENIRDLSRKIRERLLQDPESRRRLSAAASPEVWAIFINAVSQALLRVTVASRQANEARQELASLYEDRRESYRVYPLQINLMLALDALTQALVQAGGWQANAQETRLALIRGIQAVSAAVEYADAKDLEPVWPDAFARIKILTQILLRETSGKGLLDTVPQADGIWVKRLTPEGIARRTLQFFIESDFIRFLSPEEKLEAARFWLNELSQISGDDEEALERKLHLVDFLDTVLEKTAADQDLLGAVLRQNLALLNNMREGVSIRKIELRAALFELLYLVLRKTEGFTASQSFEEQTREIFRLLFDSFRELAVFGIIKDDSWESAPSVDKDYQGLAAAQFIHLAAAASGSQKEIKVTDSESEVLKEAIPILARDQHSIDQLIEIVRDGGEDTAAQILLLAQGTRPLLEEPDIEQRPGESSLDDAGAWRVIPAGSALGAGDSIAAVQTASLLSGMTTLPSVEVQPPRNYSRRFIDDFVKNRWLLADESSRRRELGGKGSGFYELELLGITEYPAVIPVTDAHVRADISADGEVAVALRQRLFNEAIPKLEKVTGKKVGDADNPLILAVRSSPEYSMPGSLDTVYAGVTREILDGLAQRNGKKFALEIEERFIRVYAVAVMGVDENEFLAVHRSILGGKSISEASESNLEEILQAYQRWSLLIPLHPEDQILAALGHLGKLWKSEAMTVTRQQQEIPENSGMAILVQEMVFGNADENSMSAVLFSRNPNTGNYGLTGRWIPQGLISDLVWGLSSGQDAYGLWENYTQQMQRLNAISFKLSSLDSPVIEYEITIEKDKLFVVQWRPAKLGPRAMEDFLYRAWHSKDITRAEYVKRVNAIAELLDGRKYFRLKSTAGGKVMASAPFASPGALAGKLVFSRAAAERELRQGHSVVLAVRQETRRDFDIMLEYPGRVGIVTNYGSDVIHEAQQARGWTIPALIAAPFRIEGGTLITDAGSIAENEAVILDGTQRRLLTGVDVTALEEWIPNDLQKSFGVNPLVYRRSVLEETEQILSAEVTDGNPETTFAVLLRLNVEAVFEYNQAHEAWDGQKNIPGDLEQAVLRADWKKHILHELMEDSEKGKTLGKTEVQEIIEDEIGRQAREKISSRAGDWILLEIEDNPEVEDSLYPYRNRPGGGESDHLDPGSTEQVKIDAKAKYPQINALLAQYPDAELQIEPHYARALADGHYYGWHFRILVVRPGKATVYYQSEVRITRTEKGGEGGRMNRKAEAVYARAKDVAGKVGGKVHVGRVITGYHDRGIDTVTYFFTVFVPQEEGASLGAALAEPIRIGKNLYVDAQQADAEGWIAVAALDNKILVHKDTGQIKYAPGVSSLVELNFDFWAIRHGETDGNTINGLFQGAVEEDLNQLNDEGKRQALDAAERLTNELKEALSAGKIHHVLASPRNRAKDTRDAFLAKAREQGLDQGIISLGEEDLADEINFGAADNKVSRDDMTGVPPELRLAEELWPAAANYRGRSDATINFEHDGKSGETFIDLIVRSVALLNKLKAEYDGKDIPLLLFAHGTLFSAVRIALGDVDRAAAYVDFRGKRQMLPNAQPVKLASAALGAVDENAQRFEKQPLINIVLLEKLVREAAQETAQELAIPFTEARLAGSSRYLQSGRRTDLDVALLVGEDDAAKPQRIYEQRRKLVGEVFAKHLNARLQPYGVSARFFEETFPRHLRLFITFPFQAGTWPYSTVMDIFLGDTWEKNIQDIWNTFYSREFRDPKNLLAIEYYAGDPEIYAEQLVDYYGMSRNEFIEKWVPRMGYWARELPGIPNARELARERLQADIKQVPLMPDSIFFIPPDQAASLGVDLSQDRLIEQVEVGGKMMEIREGGNVTINFTAMPAPTKKDAMTDFLKDTGFDPAKGFFVGNQNASPTDRDAVLTEIEGLNVIAVDAHQDKVIPQAKRVKDMGINTVGPDATLEFLDQILERQDSDLPQFIAFDVDDTVLGVIQEPSGTRKEELIKHRRDLAVRFLALIQRGVKLAFLSDGDSAVVRKRIAEALHGYLKDKITKEAEIFYYTSGMAAKLKQVIPPHSTLPPQINHDLEYGRDFRLPMEVVNILKELMGEVTEVTQGKGKGTMKGSGILWRYYVSRYATEDSGKKYKLRQKISDRYPDFKPALTKNGNVEPLQFIWSDEFPDGSATMASMFPLAATSLLDMTQPLPEGMETERRFVLRRISERLGSLQTRIIQQMRLKDKIIQVREGGNVTINITSSPAPTKKTAMQDFFKETGFEPAQGYFVGNQNSSPTERDAILTEIEGLNVIAVDEHQDRVIPQARAVKSLGINTTGPDATLEFLRQIADREDDDLPKFIALDVDDTVLGIQRSNGTAKKDSLIKDRRELAEMISSLSRRGVQIAFFSDSDSAVIQERIAGPLGNLIKKQAEQDTNVYFYTSGMAAKFRQIISVKEGQETRIIFDMDYGTAHRLPAAAVRYMKELLGEVREIKRGKDKGKMTGRGLLWEYYSTHYAVPGPDGKYSLRPEIAQRFANYHPEVSAAGNVAPLQVVWSDEFPDGSAAMLSLFPFATLNLIPEANRKHSEGQDERRYFLFHFYETVLADSVAGASLGAARGPVPASEAVEKLSEIAANFDWRTRREAKGLLAKLQTGSDFQPEDWALYHEIIAEFKFVTQRDKTWFNSTPDGKRLENVTAGVLSSETFLSDIYGGQGGLGMLFADWTQEAFARGAGNQYMPLVPLYRRAPISSINAMGQQTDAYRENWDPWSDATKYAEKIKELLARGLQPVAYPAGHEKENQEIVLKINLPKNRTLHLKVWKAPVDRGGVFMLDSDIPENEPDLRMVFDHPYREPKWGSPRFEQQWALGVGYMELIEALNLHKEKQIVAHMNETATSMVIPAMVIHYMKQGYSYEEAVYKTRNSLAFTTHTLVPAGFDSYARENVFIEDYVAAYATGKGFDGQALDIAYKLTHDTYNQRGEFVNSGLWFQTRDKSSGAVKDMQNLGKWAVGFSKVRNAVSQLNAQEATVNLAELLPVDLKTESTPAAQKGYAGVTNGVARYWFPRWIRKLLQLLRLDEGREPLYARILNPLNPDHQWLWQKIFPGRVPLQVRTKKPPSLILDGELRNDQEAGARALVDFVHNRIAGNDQQGIESLRDQMVESQDPELKRRAAFLEWRVKQIRESKFWDAAKPIFVWARRVVEYKRMLKAVIGSHLERSVMPSIHQYVRENEKPISVQEADEIIDDLKRKNAFEPFAKLLARGGQFAFAGKAFDNIGRSQIILLNRILQRAYEDHYDERGKPRAEIAADALPLEMARQVIFVPGYTENMAKYFTAGATTYIATSEVPLEASGTSPMKPLKPVIATHDGYEATHIVNRINGWLFGKRRKPPVDLDERSKRKMSEADIDGNAELRDYFVEEADDFYVKFNEALDVYEKRDQDGEWYDMRRAVIFSTLTQLEVGLSITGREVVNLPQIERREKGELPEPGDLEERAPEKGYAQIYGDVAERSRAADQNLLMKRSLTPQTDIPEVTPVEGRRVQAKTIFRFNPASLNNQSLDREKVNFYLHWGQSSDLSRWQDTPAQVEWEEQEGGIIEGTVTAQVEVPESGVDYRATFFAVTENIPEALRSEFARWQGGLGRDGSFQAASLGTEIAPAKEIIYGKFSQAGIIFENGLDSVQTIAAGQSTVVRVKVPLYFVHDNARQISGVNIITDLKSAEATDISREGEAPFYQQPMILRGEEDGYQIWEAELKPEMNGGYLFTVFVEYQEHDKNYQLWAGDLGENAYVRVFPQWALGMNTATVFARTLRRPGTEQKRFGTFTDLKWYVEELSKMGVDHALLMPLTDTFGATPYESISPFSIHPNHIDWDGLPYLPNAPPEEKYRHFMDNLAANDAEWQAFLSSPFINHIFEYADTKAIHELRTDTTQNLEKSLPSEELRAAVRGTSDYQFYAGSRERPGYYVYQQFIARKQLQETIQLAHDKKVKMSFDKVFFESDRGAYAVHHPAYFKRGNDGKIIYPYWDKSPDKSHHHDWKGQGVWDYDWLYNSNYRPITDIFSYWLDDLGFDGFRWDAAHMGRHDTHRAVNEQVLRAHPQVLGMAEQLGGYEQDARDLVRNGFLLYHLVENAAKGGYDELVRDMINMSLDYHFRVSSTHDSPRLPFVLAAVLGKSQTVDEEAAKMRAAHRFLALAQENYTILQGDEFGQGDNTDIFKDRINVPGDADEDWDILSPGDIQSHHYDLRDHIANLIGLRKENTAFTQPNHLHFLWSDFNAFTRSDARQEILVINNMSGETLKGKTIYDFSRYGLAPGAVFRVRDLEGGEIKELTISDSNVLEVELGPGEGLVFDMKTVEVVSGKETGILVAAAQDKAAAALGIVAEQAAIQSEIQAEALRYSLSRDDFYQGLAQGMELFISLDNQGKPALFAGGRNTHFGDQEWSRDFAISNLGLAALAGLQTTIHFPGQAKPAGEVSRDLLLRWAGVDDHGRTRIDAFNAQGNIMYNVINWYGSDNHNTVDAPLWFVEAVYQHVALSGDTALLNETAREGKTMLDVLWDIVDRYAMTRAQLQARGIEEYSVQMDEATGFVLIPRAKYTWMDTDFTPRQGYPVEIQALWYNALKRITDLSEMAKSPRTGQAQELAERVKDHFAEYFWNEQGQYLYDILGADGLMSAEGSKQRGYRDAVIRPNMIFAVIYGLLDQEKSEAVIQRVKEKLLIPGALRSLAPGTAVPPFGYYRHDHEVAIRDGLDKNAAYHNGLGWVWLYPFYYIAAVQEGVMSAEQAEAEMLKDLKPIVANNPSRSLPELLSGDAYGGIHARRGPDSQAWSVATALFALQKIRGLVIREKRIKYLNGILFSERQGMKFTQLPAADLPQALTQIEETQNWVKREPEYTVKTIAGIAMSKDSLEPLIQGGKMFVLKDQDGIYHFASPSELEMLQAGNQIVEASSLGNEPVVLELFRDRYQALRDTRPAEAEITEAVLAKRMRRVISPDGKPVLNGEKESKAVFFSGHSISPDVARFQRRLKEVFTDKIYLVDEDKLHLTVNGLDAETGPFDLKILRANWDPEIGVFFEAGITSQAPQGGQVSRLKEWNEQSPRPPHITAAYFAQPFSQEDVRALNRLIEEEFAAADFGAYSVEIADKIAYTNLSFNSGVRLIEQVPFVSSGRKVLAAAASDRVLARIKQMNAVELKRTLRAAHASGLLPLEPLLNEYADIELAADESRYEVSALTVFRKINGQWHFLIGRRQPAVDEAGLYMFPAGIWGEERDDKYETAEEARQNHLLVSGDGLDLPGRIDKESQAAAAAREFSEETGLHVRATDLDLRLPDVIVKRGGRYFLVHRFAVVQAEEDESLPGSEEWGEAQWLPFEVLLSGNPEQAPQRMQGELDNRLGEAAQIMNPYDVSARDLAESILLAGSLGSQPFDLFRERYDKIRREQPAVITEADLQKRVRRFLDAKGNILPGDETETTVAFIPADNAVLQKIAEYQEKAGRILGDAVFWNRQDRIRLTVNGLDKSASPFRVSLTEPSWDAEGGIFLEIEVYGFGIADANIRRLSTWGNNPRNPVPRVTLGYFTKPLTAGQIDALRSLNEEYKREPMGSWEISQGIKVRSREISLNSDLQETGKINFDGYAADLLDLIRGELEEMLQHPVSEAHVLEGISAIFGLPTPRDVQRHLRAKVILQHINNLEAERKLEVIAAIVKDLQVTTWHATGEHRFMPIILAIVNSFDRQDDGLGHDIFSAGPIHTLHSVNHAFRYLTDVHQLYANPQDIAVQNRAQGMPSLRLSLPQKQEYRFLDIGSAPKIHGAPTLNLLTQTLQRMYPDSNFTVYGNDVFYPRFEYRDGHEVVRPSVFQTGEFDARGELDFYGVRYLDAAHPGNNVTSPEFMQGDYDRGSFDFITASMAIHQMRKPGETIRKLRLARNVAWENENGKIMVPRYYMSATQRDVYERLMSKLSVGGIFFVNLPWGAEYKENHNLDLFLIIQRTGDKTYRIYDQAIPFRPNYRIFSSAEYLMEGYKGAFLPELFDNPGINRVFPARDIDFYQQIRALLARADLLAYRYQTRDHSVWTRVQEATQAVKARKNLREIFAVYMQDIPDEDRVPKEFSPENEAFRHDALLKARILREAEELDSRTVRTEAQSLGSEVLNDAGRARGISAAAALGVARDLTERIFFLPGASPEQIAAVLELLGDKQIPSGNDVAAKIAAFNLSTRAAMSYLRQQVPPAAAGSPAGLNPRIPLIVDGLVFKEETESEQTAAKIAAVLQAKDLLIYLHEGEKPALLHRLYQILTGKARVKDLAWPLVTAGRVAQMTQGFGRGVMVRLVSDGQTAIQFDGDSVFVDINELRNNGVDLGQAVALLREIASEQDTARRWALFRAAGFDEPPVRDGAWTMGRGFVELLLSDQIQTQQQALQLLASAA